MRRCMSEPSSRGAPSPGGALNVFAALGLVLPVRADRCGSSCFSFNEPVGQFNFVWQEFTLDNWRDPFSDEALTDAFVESLKIAAISTAIATVLGSMIAIALARYQFRGVGRLNLFLVLPLTTPEIVLGSSLATLFLDADVDPRLHDGRSSPT